MISIYASMVLPLTFILIITSGEVRRTLVLFAWGLSSALIVYGISELLMTYTDLPTESLTGLVLPSIEEIVKILPLLILGPLIIKKGDAWQFPRLALASGIGFAILENSLYLQLISESSQSPLAFIILRSLTACMMHGAVSGLIGMALFYCASRWTHWITMVPALGFIAIAIHSSFNILGTVQGMEWTALIIPIALFGLEVTILGTFSLHRNTDNSLLGQKSHA